MTSLKYAEMKFLTLKLIEAYVVMTIEVFIKILKIYSHFYKIIKYEYMYFGENILIIVF